MKNRIKDILKEKGMSQTFLAKKLEKDFRTVNAYCNNHYQPSVVVLYRISGILQVDIMDLLDDES